ncbi:HAMP domain-containing sensor histidine kinase [Mediterraneibacter glycyrrhizinilyticus]|uniref:sensor histidine kinase n=1 Tax=Mediterraneibacter glycyrrhizinilyticus TaxID=342942 RepID=UPI0025AB562D|nr:HAMP domain-containing sensor histidine kinase [Mediterraneibacter glycyrrhizinilyticus]MDN0043674.1 HAMP domain-containing sensor histidine kinase [Mediterraneibacter glycyrrhizinilyticus]MDN0060748.1 HAMP domain-containing sensor histidine kinase [Mediterraneibacter glycyrrhizinilyticus]
MNEIIYFVPAAAAALAFGGLYAYKIRKYKRELRKLSSEMDRILHGSEELVLSSYREGDIAILRDEIYKMTVRLREQSERLSEDKGALADALADISHQIRTPLTTLNIMTARMMKEGDDPGQRERLLREMNRMLERIEWLITALLKMSKLDAGSITLEPAVISMEEFLTRALEPFEIQMELKDQSCEINGAQGITFSADEAWTLEAVRNVLKNSLEYTPAGEKLVIDCSENPVFTEIAVSDNGPGIDPEDMPHLFERFYRGKNAESSSFGIGLALAQSIMSRQNGIIRAENRTGGGSVFRIRFYRQNV